MQIDTVVVYEHIVLRRPMREALVEFEQIAVALVPTLVEFFPRQTGTGRIEGQADAVDLNALSAETGEPRLVHIADVHVVLEIRVAEEDFHGSSSGCAGENQAFFGFLGTMVGRLTDHASAPRDLALGAKQALEFAALQPFAQRVAPRVG